jgi:TonB-dependent receptor
MPDAAPYLRNETLEYTERTTQTFQLSGRHTLPDPELEMKNVITLLPPEIDWVVSHSSAAMDQPDKRLFGTMWRPFVPSAAGRVPTHFPLKPAAQFTLGNLQRIWKEITEKSDQYTLNLKFPFEQWTESEGYFKVGIFNDKVHREYNQDSFSNFSDTGARYQGPFEDLWSTVFPSEDHAITAADIDVDYDGEQKITAWYYMADVPLTSFFNIIGGARFERTELGIVNFPELDVKWIPPGATTSQDMNPGDGDVTFRQSDVLPSIGFAFTPIEKVKLRGSYSETVARQTFKELTPIQQQEYLGADVFIGNPALKMSALKNYDLRLDYTPYDGGLISFSYFYKDITDPIEYVQRVVGFTFTTPVNYPEGKLSGYEIELRQRMEHFWDKLAGLSLGANATFIDSEVTLPDEEAAQFNQPSIMAPMKKRDMTNAPEHLYNLYLTYDLERFGTQFGLFYTVRGDTLVAGAGQKGKFIPNIYETEFGTLNFSLSQKLGETWKVKFQAKNLTDPKIQTVYRSEYIGGDVTKTSYQKGMEFSISASAAF